jgi:hypothetical protein
MKSIHYIYRLGAFFACTIHHSHAKMNDDEGQTSPLLQTPPYIYDDGVDPKKAPRWGVDTTQLLCTYKYNSNNYATHKTVMMR